MLTQNNYVIVIIWLASLTHERPVSPLRAEAANNEPSDDTKSYSFASGLHVLLILSRLLT